MNEIIQLDPEYKNFINELKQKVASARMRAMLSANAEQIRLYWGLGRGIIDHQKNSAWDAEMLKLFIREPLSRHFQI